MQLLFLFDLLFMLFILSVSFMVILEIDIRLSGTEKKKHMLINNCNFILRRIFKQKYGFRITFSLKTEKFRSRRSFIPEIWFSNLLTLLSGLTSAAFFFTFFKWKAYLAIFFSLSLQRWGERREIEKRAKNSRDLKSTGSQFLLSCTPSANTKCKPPLTFGVLASDYRICITVGTWGASRKSGPLF